MTMNALAEKLSAWLDRYGWDDESLNNFANIHATSYEEYNAIWEILEELKRNKGLINFAFKRRKFAFKHFWIDKVPIPCYNKYTN